jgi:hypothetical protein
MIIVAIIRNGFRKPIPRLIQITPNDRSSLLSAFSPVPKAFCQHMRVAAFSALVEIHDTE